MTLVSIIFLSRFKWINYKISIKPWSTISLENIEFIPKNSVVFYQLKWGSLKKSIFKFSHWKCIFAMIFLLMSPINAKVCLAFVSSLKIFTGNFLPKFILLEKISPSNTVEYLYLINWWHEKYYYLAKYLFNVSSRNKNDEH